MLDVHVMYYRDIAETGKNAYSIVFAETVNCFWDETDIICFILGYMVFFCYEVWPQSYLISAV